MTPNIQTCENFAAALTTFPPDEAGRIFRQALGEVVRSMRERHGLSEVEALEFGIAFGDAVRAALDRVSTTEH
jgi:hypothetical protein